MRQFLASVLVIVTVTAVAASQAPVAGKPRISACSLLSFELAEKVGGIDKRMEETLPS